jgi:hypothetical protein
MKRDPVNVAESEGFGNLLLVGSALVRPHIVYGFAAFFRAAHLFFMAALIRALPSALSVPRLPLCVLMPAISWRACCSRDISASIAAIRLG